MLLMKEQGDNGFSIGMMTRQSIGKRRMHQVKNAGDNERPDEGRLRPSIVRS
jgi:hypothetical protein